MKKVKIRNVNEEEEKKRKMQEEEEEMQNRSEKRRRKKKRIYRSLLAIRPRRNYSKTENTIDFQK